LEAQLAEVHGELEARNAEFELMAADLGQESEALAGRVAELYELLETATAALDAARSQAARVEPLSNELTSVRAELSERQAEFAAAVDAAAKSAELAARISSLESELAPAKAAAAASHMLQMQVDGLNTRVGKAEAAAEFAIDQLSDLIATVDEAETQVIRRAAAAEVARIRELTEESLGIAREATVGTGLEADDYVPPPVPVNGDPDDWSDVDAAGVVEESVVSEVVSEVASDSGAGSGVEESVVSEVASDSEVSSDAAGGESEAVDDAAIGSSADESHSARVLPIEMADRLRLARAELEAEIEAEFEAEVDSGAQPAEGTRDSEDDAEETVAILDPAADEPGVARKTARETRYARQSAKLPRLTEVPSEEAEGLSSMAGFRARMLRSKTKSTD
jgi:hypothetical protein